jgi:hypothetical protein
VEQVALLHRRGGERVGAAEAAARPCGLVAARARKRRRARLGDVDVQVQRQRVGGVERERAAQQRLGPGRVRPQVAGLGVIVPGRGGKARWGNGEC